MAAEAEAAVRLAIILGSEIFVPAAAYYENNIAKKIFEHYRDTQCENLFYLVGGGVSADQFAEDKLEQYPEGTKIGTLYRRRLQQPFPWRERGRSSTADIKSDWLRAAQTGDVIQRLVADGRAVAREADREWLALPDRLGRTAFIPENACNLLPSLGGDFVARRNIGAFINNSYFKSYLLDVEAGLFQKMPWLSGGLTIDTKNPELDVDFAALTSRLRESGALHDILNASVDGLRRFVDEERFLRAYESSQAYYDHGSVGAAQNIKGSTKSAGTRGVKDFLVVAARQELDAVREYLRENGYSLLGKNFGNRRVEVFDLEVEAGGRIAVGLIMASAKGKSEMKALLEAIDRHNNPSHVVMVGMMAGIKNKTKLLDVIVPKTIFDVTAIGTKGDALISEPEAANLDAKLHGWVSSMELQGSDPIIIAHKKTVTVAAKIDDISHDLAKTALSVDPENVVGLEMEGSAFAEKQSAQSLEGRAVGYLMIKGVADYAGEKPDDAEIIGLKSVAGVNKHLNDPDPTNSVKLKAALQREATRRAVGVALQLLASVPRN